MYNDSNYKDFRKKEKQKRNITDKLEPLTAKRKIIETSV